MCVSEAQSDSKHPLARVHTLKWLGQWVLKEQQPRATVFLSYIQHSGLTCSAASASGSVT